MNIEFNVAENATAEMVNITGRGREIMAARKAIGWSRQTAACYLGVSEQTLTRWEKGSTRYIRPESYRRLEDILNGNATMDE